MGRAALATALAAGLAACGGSIGGSRSGGNRPGGAPGPERAPGLVAELTPAMVRAYNEAGLITNLGAFPYVGSVGYFAGPTPDSTLVLLSVSFANRVLTFTREEDRYRGSYDAHVEVVQGATTVRSVVGTQVVRVSSVTESARAIESVIFQQDLLLAPGTYGVTITLRDDGSPRAGTAEVSLTVPRIGSTSLSTPLAVYQASPRGSPDSALRLVASPRATVTFARDTVANLYLEGYGDSGTALPIAVSVRGGGGIGDTATVWSDTIALPRHAAVFSGVAVVPLGRVGIGPASLVFRRVDGAAGDTVRATIFVGFADDLPVASYEEMLNYLKYFPAPDRVTALRDVAPAGRAAAWVQFVRVTNPNPATPRNEALDNYIQRLRQANERYTGEGIPGWQTDRGMVFISIGEPDQSYAQGSLQGSARGREQVWVYHQYNAQLTFEDVKGFGRYTLARRSEAQFRALMKRIREKATAPAPASTSP